MSKEEHPPAFLLYAQDFVSDSKVEAMTTREVGAYFLLLCKAWHEKPVGTIPNDDHVLARWARLTPDEWTECRSAVLSPFKPCPDNRLLSPRLSSEFRKLMESRKKKAVAGKLGATVRWQRSDESVASPSRRRDSADTVKSKEGATDDPAIESLSNEYRDVIDAWREATGLSCAPDKNTREGVRIFADAIANENFPRDALASVIKSGLSDPNLPSQGLRGVANNRCKYLPKRSAAPRSPPPETTVPERRWIMECDACGFRSAAVEPEENGEPAPIPCWNPTIKPKCPGIMRVVHDGERGSNGK